MGKPYKNNSYIIEGLICKIICYDKDGNIKDTAIIDIWNIDKCKPYKWGTDRQHYVVNRKIKLHQLISGLISPDHINRNPLDCREENLRPASKSQNAANANKIRTNTSGYKGVCLNKRTNKWQSAIHYDNKSIHLGVFLSKDDAALAYNQKALELFGEFACLNVIKPKLKRRNPL